MTTPPPTREPAAAPIVLGMPVIEAPHMLKPVEFILCSCWKPFEDRAGRPLCVHERIAKQRLDGRPLVAPEQAPVEDMFTASLRDPVLARAIVDQLAKDATDAYEEGIKDALQGHAPADLVEKYAPAPAEQGATREWQIAQSPEEAVQFLAALASDDERGRVDSITVPAETVRLALALLRGRPEDSALAMLRRVLDLLPVSLISDGNAPGHGHSIPGVWDADNGPPTGGTRCEWCKTYFQARALLNDARRGGK